MQFSSLELVIHLLIAQGQTQRAATENAPRYLANIRPRKARASRKAGSAGKAG